MKAETEKLDLNKIVNTVMGNVWSEYETKYAVFESEKVDELNYHNFMEKVNAISDSVHIQLRTEMNDANEIWMKVSDFTTRYRKTAEPNDDLARLFDAVDSLVVKLLRLVSRSAQNEKFLQLVITKSNELVKITSSLHNEMKLLRDDIPSLKKAIIEDVESKIAKLNESKPQVEISPQTITKQELIPSPKKIESLEKTEKEMYEKLTNKAKECHDLIKLGRTKKQIKKAMKIGDSTIKTYISNMRKAGLEDIRYSELD